MSKEKLTIYLNDHLAGSVGALELVDHLIETYKGKPLEQFFKDLRNEINVPQLRALDYTRLQKRAAEQCDRVEAKRLEVAREVFSSD
jgi:hypothetical protein